MSIVIRSNEARQGIGTPYTSSQSGQTLPVADASCHYRCWWDGETNRPGGIEVEHKLITDRLASRRAEYAAWRNIANGRSGDCCIAKSKWQSKSPPGQQEACRSPRWHGRSPPESRQDRCSAVNGECVPTPD